MISEHGAAFCGVRPPWAAGSRQRAERTRFSPLFRRERNNDRNARFACGRAFCSVCWHKQKRKGGRFLFFLSKGVRFLFLIGERFLFLKKRNKRHCGGGFLSEKRMFPAHPTQLYRKTDGFHMNRPFCVACWRKQQERRETIVPQMIFFCFFSSKKKRRPPISAAVQWRGSRPRSPPYPRSPPRPRCNGPYDPSE